jgi:phosphoglycolate phosphatase-like HAD superfamily hydrolase
MRGQPTTTGVDGRSSDMADPLPGWRDGRARKAIVDFVTRVTGSGADHVPVSERIATFDNDGTLWCEQPLPVEAFFLIDRVRELAAADPALAERDPFKALLEGDQAWLHALGKRGIMEMLFATHAGTTLREFATIAQAWQARAQHPQLGTRFVDLVYQPQLELIDYLHANGFKCFIVTGGGIDFVRACSEPRYGIPPEQVIGSSAQLRVDISARGLTLFKLPTLGNFNDREAKVENIGLHIGRRPILAFGNSDGDFAMLRFVAAGAGPRLALLVRHDDAEREFAYDRDFSLSPLAEALDRAADHGICVVSIKDDWATIFTPRD